MLTQNRPEPSHDRLSKFAWNLLANQMLLTQLAGSVQMVKGGKPIIRVCRHCGTLASEAIELNEPVCSRHVIGQIDAHSYVDLDVAELMRGEVQVECPTCDGHGEYVARVLPPGRYETPDEEFDYVTCPGCRGSGQVAMGRAA